MPKLTEHVSFDIYPENSGNDYIIYRFIVVYNYFEELTRFHVQQRQRHWKRLKTSIQNHK